MVALAHTRRVRVLIADDHRLVAAAAQRALERSGAFEVVATATRGSEVVPKVGQLRPDVLLLDVSMPGIDGIGCLERVCKRWPELRVVMLSASAADDVVDAARGTERRRFGTPMRTGFSRRPSGATSREPATRRLPALHADRIPQRILREARPGLGMGCGLRRGEARCTR